MAREILLIIYLGGGFTIFGSDIKMGEDFITSNRDDFDCIVTNPPFSIKDKWLEKCYSYGKPFALLLPLTALEGKFRHKLYKKHGIQVILFDGRVQYRGHNSGSCWFASAWFCYGLNLPNQLNFVELNQCQHSITTKEQDFSNASNLKGQIDNLDENSSADIINKELSK